MYVLDTNVVSELVRPHPDRGVMSWLVTIPREALLLPSVVVAELYFGVEQLPAGRRRDALLEFTDAFVAAGGADGILPFTVSEARAYAHIGAERRRMGRPMTVVDAQIAATAAVRKLPVVTRNARHFHDCGIEVINPWSSPLP